MKQWDIVLYPFDVEKPHPVVIISTDERCQNEKFLTVNALFCRTIRARRPLDLNIEVPLDKSDGLDWETAVSCHHIHELPKAAFKEIRGRVASYHRQKAIFKTLHKVFRFPQIP